MKTTNVMIDAICKVYEGSKDKKLEKNSMKLIQSELRTISHYLKITQEQALLFSIVIMDSFEGDHISIRNIAKHFDINLAEFLTRLELFTQMEKKGLISSKPYRQINKDILSNREVIVHEKIINAILKNEPCPVIEKPKVEKLIEALGELFSLFEALDSGDISVHCFRTTFRERWKEYERFPFIKQLSSLDMQTLDRVLLITVIWDTLNGINGVDIEPVVKALQHRPSDRMSYTQDMKNEINPLIKNGLMEVHPSRFLNNLELKPSSKLADMLLPHGIKMETRNIGNNNLITPENIAPKTLFYNKQEEEQLSSLYQLMREENYQKMVDRLKSRHLPLSVNILLYGSPGTGKTESVFQLARNSGREIIKVDISNTKSMWYGESEKMIKRIFTNYATYAESCSIAPILFFNEADAILGKRKEQGSRPIDQTENTIQNILLEELENFKGIFMATTNLATNLDKAFERRFLFKVEFQKPSLESRTLIWIDKLPFLSEVDARVLAERFELSGGQIENIVRKSEIEFILHGKNSPIEKILAYCEEETIYKEKGRTTIGF